MDNQTIDITKYDLNDYKTLYNLVYILDGQNKVKQSVIKDLTSNINHLVDNKHKDIKKYLNDNDFIVIKKP
nr:hypothetical protein [uncultured Mediterranean phage uvMED]BAR17920.1 hypothetical protein [uncultured Mediterranean phage uvMED]